MSPYEDACPYEAQSRAKRCQGCVATNSIPPCAAAFLSGRTTGPVENVIQLRRIEVAPVTRKAA